MVVNAGIVSAVRELLLDISDSLMLWLTSVILKVILLSKIFEKNMEYQPGLFIGSLPNLIKKNYPAFSFVR